MITIVIADDEKLIRAGINKMLKSFFQDINIIEAKNGKEALELIQKSKSDIVITDIRMPIMDGVELMKNIHEFPESQKPSIIVLSGFDDFSYAKAAIQNGAVSYILKPVDKDELINSVKTAIESSSLRKRHHSEMALKNISVQGRFNKDSIPEGVSFEGKIYCICVSGPRCGTCINPLLESVKHYVIEQKSDFLCLVIPEESIPVLEKATLPLGFFVGISRLTQDISMLRKLKEESFTALLESFFSNKNRNLEKGIYYYKNTLALPDFSEIDVLYEKIISLLNISDPEEIAKKISLLLDFSKLEQTNCAPVLNYIYNKLINDFVHRFPSYTSPDMYLYVKGIMIENIWQYDTLSEWKHSVSDYAIYLSALLKRNLQEYPFINEALSYIKKNFTSNINMAMVANYVSVNYTWFSEKFKEHTGFHFNDYLKKLRLEEAENLLAKSCYKVYEVAQKSGFNDVKYFMKTFRDATGLSPGEWRRKHQTE